MRVDQKSKMFDNLSSECLTICGLKYENPEDLINPISHNYSKILFSEDSS